MGIVDYFVNFFTDGFIFFPMAACAVFAIACVLLQALSILWSPVAAIICSVIAYRRHLNVWAYALGGALCSISFFLPWLLLMKGMLGKPFLLSDIRGANRLIHGLWFAWVVAHFAATMVFMDFVEVSFQDALDAWSWPLERNRNVYFLFNGAFLVTGAALLILSWMSPMGRRVGEYYGEETYLPSLTLVAKTRLLLPFTLTALNIASLPIYIYLWRMTN